MPLDFGGMYVLSNPSNNYLKSIQIAMAPKLVEVTNTATGEKEKEWQYLSANDVSLGHTIRGEVLSDKDGVVDMKDLRRDGDDGKDVVWRFEPLTYARWKALGEQGSISGYTPASSIKTDADVIHMYQMDWLQPCLSWWKLS
jgi:hypothetical protein